MKYATRLLALSLVFMLAAPALADMRVKLLRDYAISAGLVEPSGLVPHFSTEKAKVGKQLFETTTLSLNGDTSCKTCHLDEFSSADGLPNAVGVFGQGKGPSRMRSGGAIIPRNTLPLWGRGSVGFNVFFWDGKVDASSNELLSQFGSHAPSDDPLVVAVHLPFVEIREMLVDTGAVAESFRKENVQAAFDIYELLSERLRANDDLAGPLAKAFQIAKRDIEFRHIAEAIAVFVRDKFRVRQTKFHKFVFGNGTLDSDEVAGGLLFYGKGRCAICHNGPFFSDLKFHAIPFPQVGFGKNGFGIDYGRFNVTFRGQDTYKFRTPPLYNVVKTAPYSHSGSVAGLRDAIRYHFDPLRDIDTENMTLVERTEFYKRLKAWGSESVQPNVLSDDEIKNLVAFLHTLSF